LLLPHSPEEKAPAVYRDRVERARVPLRRFLVVYLPVASGLLVIWKLLGSGPNLAALALAVVPAVFIGAFYLAVPWLARKGPT